MYPLVLMVGLCLVFYVLIVCIVIPTFFSPLSKIPSAHFTASFSPVWMLWKRYTECENRAIHAAHQRYGDIVRLGPNEISINCVDNGIRTVYSGGFEKWNWYSNLFDNYGVPNMFSMAKSKSHAARKRIVSNVYSKSYIQSSPDFHQVSQAIIYDRLLPSIDKAARNSEPLDVLELNYASAMDFIMAYIFGLGGGSNFILDIAARQHWLRVYQSRRPFQFWDGELPSLTSLSRRLKLPVVPSWVATASRELEDWTMRHCKSAEEKSESESKIPSDDHIQTSSPVVLGQLSNYLPSNTGPPKNLQIATELHDHLAAGHETTGITLTYLFLELSRNIAVQAALRSELLTLSPNLTYPPPDNISPRGVPHPRSIDALPLLHACLMETLRLHAAIPGPQPRITPSPPVSLAHSPALPAGIRVSAQAYSLHRNATVFPDPEIWKPARWLNQTDSQRAEMAKWFWAFGSGGRMCVGSHFAMQEMKVITAAIYSNYTTAVVDDEGIEQVDAYTAGPRGNQLIVQFEHV